MCAQPICCSCLEVQEHGLLNRWLDLIWVTKERRMYVHTHAHTYTQSHTYSHIHTHTYTQTHTYTHIHTHNTHTHTTQNTQVGATLFGIFGLGGFEEPRHKLHDCKFCDYSFHEPIMWFDTKVVPRSNTESDFTASVIGCGCVVGTVCIIVDGWGWE
jgi:hypothetical protein